ncbi:MAG: hypothetical protein HY329_23855 [Chloroflexi bacterium]|nr:hypothetical protein [Chloroflexota bacterium]
MELIIGAGILGVIIVILVMVIVIFLVVPKLVTKAMEPALERRLSKVYAPEQLVLRDLKAVTLGLESKGVMQLRGNGALVLTANELGWFRFVPERSDLRIPRENITKVDTVQTHLGKTYFRDLLRVTFMNNGRPDSMAWYVTDLGAWLTRLREPAETA